MAADRPFHGRPPATRPGLPSRTAPLTDKASWQGSSVSYLRFFALSFLFLLSTLAWAEAAGLVFSMLHVRAPADWNKLLMVPGFLLGAGAVALAGRRFRPAPGSPGRLAWIALLILPLALNVASIPLYNLSLWLVPPGPYFYALERLFQPTGAWPDTLGIVLAVVCIGPLVEEFVFRGVLMEGLLRAGKGMHTVVWLQAFVFGAMHANPWQFFYAFFIGALFGYLRIWTGGIALTSGIHMLVNGLSMLALYFDVGAFGGTGTGEMVNMDPIWPGLALFATGLVALPFWKNYRSTSSRASA